MVRSRNDWAIFELIERALASALEDPPCGPNLEYDPSFLELEAAAHPIAQPEFGEAGLRSPGIDWQWVERRALSMLDRSKDLRIAVLVLRAWVRLRGVEGLTAGLALVFNLLGRYWHCLHPQLDAEDNDDATMRISALATLTHHEGLLSDLRACALAWDAFEPITVRDLELALRLGGSPSPAGGQRKRAPQEILRLVREEGRRTTQLGEDLQQASRFCDDLQRLLIDRIGPGRATDIAPLSKLVMTLRVAFPIELSARGIEPFEAPAVAGVVADPRERRAAAPGAISADPLSELLAEDDTSPLGTYGLPEPSVKHGRATPAPHTGNRVEPYEPLHDTLIVGPAAKPDAGADPFADFFELSPAAAADVSVARSPVLLGVSAPRAAAAGETFSARFVAYAEALEARVRQILTDLDSDHASPVLGLAPERMAAWRVGTPVTVRLSGERITVAPAERFFEWSGAHNLVSFSVAVSPDAPAGPIQILFEAFIAAVPIASIPLTLQVDAAARPETQTATAAAPKTAFASYASADAGLVAMCLSTLARWDPGLKVFMDCLDLSPNENWRDELERVIAQVDAFMLFWSKHAMASPWVKWEWQTARDKKGIAFIRPFPLDDPAMAPPPEELKHLHFRDRYLMARKAMLQLADEIRSR